MPRVTWQAWIKRSIESATEGFRDIRPRSSRANNTTNVHTLTREIGATQTALLRQNTLLVHTKLRATTIANRFTRPTIFRATSTTTERTKRRFWFVFDSPSTVIPTMRERNPCSFSLTLQLVTTTVEAELLALLGAAFDFWRPQDRFWRPQSLLFIC